MSKTAFVFCPVAVEYVVRTGWQILRANIQVMVGSSKPALIGGMLCDIAGGAGVISLVRECEAALCLSVRGILLSHPAQEQLVGISI